MDTKPTPQKKFFSDKRNIFAVAGIILLVILGGLYFFYKQKSERSAIEEVRVLTEAEKKVVQDMEITAKAVGKPTYKEVLKMQADLKKMSEKNNVQNE